MARGIIRRARVAYGRGLRGQSERVSAKKWAAPYDFGAARRAAYHPIGV
jgi:hypothetical protein